MLLIDQSRRRIDPLLRNHHHNHDDNNGNNNYDDDDRNTRDAYEYVWAPSTSLSPLPETTFPLPPLPPKSSPNNHRSSPSSSSSSHNQSDQSHRYDDDGLRYGYGYGYGYASPTTRLPFRFLPPDRNGNQSKNTSRDDNNHTYNHNYNYNDAGGEGGKMVWYGYPTRSRLLAWCQTELRSDRAWGRRRRGGTTRGREEGHISSSPIIMQDTSHLHDPHPNPHHCLNPNPNPNPNPDRPTWWCQIGRVEDLRAERPTEKTISSSSEEEDDTHNNNDDNDDNDDDESGEFLWVRIRDLTYPCSSLYHHPHLHLDNNNNNKKNNKNHHHHSTEWLRARAVIYTPKCREPFVPTYLSDLIHHPPHLHPMNPNTNANKPNSNPNPNHNPNHNPSTCTLSSPRIVHSSALFTEAGDGKRYDDHIAGGSGSDGENTKMKKKKTKEKKEEYQKE